MALQYQYQGTTEVRSDVFHAATDIREWQPAEPRSSRSRRPQRDGSVWVVLAAEAVSLAEWSPTESRAFHPPLRPVRDQRVAPIVSGFEATTIDQWAPYGPIQYRVRHPQRDHTSFTLLSGFEATPLEQWNPTDPTRYRLRGPQRDDSVFPILLGFEATGIEHWQAIEWQRARRADRRHPEPPSFITEVPVAPPTSLDQWAPYGPIQYRVRGPQRDDGSYPIISGFEATGIEQWHGSTIHVVRRAWAVHPDLASTITVLVVQPTTVDQWQPYEPTRIRDRPPNRAESLLVQFLELPAPTTVEHWLSYDARVVPRIRIRRREGSQHLQIIGELPVTQAQITAVLDRLDRLERLIQTLATQFANFRSDLERPPFVEFPAGQRMRQIPQYPRPPYAPGEG